MVVFILAVRKLRRSAVYQTGYFPQMYALTGFSLCFLSSFYFGPDSPWTCSSILPFDKYRIWPSVTV